MNYWVIIDNQKVGPMSLTELMRIPLTPETMVWHTGMADWRKAASFPELAPLFGTTVQEPPAAPDYTDPYPRQSYMNRQPAAARPRMPETYLGWNIVAIFLCCCIPAIIGVIYSSKVSSRYNSGDYEGARSASTAACGWLIASIVAWVVIQLPIMLFFNAVDLVSSL